MGWLTNLVQRLSPKHRAFDFGTVFALIDTKEQRATFWTGMTDRVDLSVSDVTNLVVESKSLTKQTLHIYVGGIPSFQIDGVVDRMRVLECLEFIRQQQAAPG